MADTIDDTAINMSDKNQAIGLVLKVFKTVILSVMFHM
jgi:hypothetical protein